MPAKSENQQQAAGAALAAKRGKIPVEDLYGASKKMYESMSKEELEEFAGTKTKGLPKKKAKSKKKKSNPKSDFLGYIHGRKEESRKAKGRG